MLSETEADGGGQAFPEAVKGCFFVQFGSILFQLKSILSVLSVHCEKLRSCSGCVS